MMMGSNDDDAHNGNLYSSTDPLESVVLESSSHTYMSISDYKSTMSGSLPVNESHPLSSPTQDSLGRNFRDSFAKRFPSSSNAGEDLLVESPSYADVIFTPYVGNTVSNGGSKELSNSLPLSSSSSSYSEYLSITVSQPQKVQDNASSSLLPGSNTYYTYLIVTYTNIPQYGGNDFSVRRRFRDVVTLADRLAESYRGYFIPSRPDKNVVESQVMQKQEFIEQRRMALEKYLRRLASHPIFRKSDELRLFLQSQGKLPLLPTTDMASRMLDGAAKLPRQLFGEGSVVITPHDVAQPAKGGRDLVRLFKELKQSVTNEWGGVKPAVSEEDKEFVERKEKLQELERRLSEASQRAEALVKGQQEVGETMGELGLAFFKIAKFEMEEAVYNTQRTHAVDAKRVGTAAVKASRFYREANAQSVKHLDQLHEYLSLMQSIQGAFNDRSNALLTVQTLGTELSSLSTRIDRLTVASSKTFGGDKSRNRRVEELQDAIKTTEEARDKASREYKRIKDINRAELERFDCDMQRDFLEMLKGYVHNEVAYGEKIANVWSKVAEEANPHTIEPASPIFGTPRPS